MTITEEIKAYQPKTNEEWKVAILEHKKLNAEKRKCDISDLEGRVQFDRNGIGYISIRRKKCPVENENQKEKVVSVSDTN